MSDRLTQQQSELFNRLSDNWRTLKELCGGRDTRKFISAIQSLKRLGLVESTFVTAEALSYRLTPFGVKFRKDRT